MNLLLAVGLFAGTFAGADSVGQPVDISQSAYQYRADRKPDANPPESWLALIHYAQLPLNKPVDINSREIKHALCGLLWEEIRPVQTLELTWPPSAKHIPPPDQLNVSALMSQSASSSWWNNLKSVPQAKAPEVSNSGRTYRYALGQSTCGLVVSVAGAKDAASFDVPQTHVFVPDTWSFMSFQVEWGFDSNTSANDYSGHVEAYDGRVSGVEPLEGDSKTKVEGTAWRSAGRSPSRRGIQMNLLYMGKSKWRKTQPYTSQPEDVARTIVTIWTKSGSFSFLASDLENGPILAPEFGFFVRRLMPYSSLHQGSMLRVIPVPMMSKMDDIAGDSRLKGWGSNETPWFGSNSTDSTVNAKGIVIPPKSAAMHPGQFVDAVAEWRSPVTGYVSLSGRLTHAQVGGNGIEWWIAHDAASGRKIIGHGTTDGAGSVVLYAGINWTPIQVGPGDRLSLIIGPKGDHSCDTTILDLRISEVGGDGRTWNLNQDVAASPTEANPHRDSFGNPGVWRFCSEMPMLGASGAPNDPPIKLASEAQSGAEFEAELKTRGQTTIREKIRAHDEQTWLGAVNATRGPMFPPFPAPPTGSEPVMQVHVPSDRLTAQWNLGTWHLLRHCATNPKTGRLWFNDYPYGILAAETYLVLSVLDQMGSHQQAADGFDQWLSLPLERDHPVGDFSEGHGALTYAEGPPGVGGNMDGIHAFGAGAIGWALTQHYWMTGDTKWLMASAPRILANAAWMSRQRRLLSGMVPGGERLWCKGLQPALQVTPDSGGLWMQFYEAEGYYWSSMARFADALSTIDPASGAKLKAEAESYRKDLRAAVDRSITLSPLVPVRDGTYHSVVPFACYVRGLATGAWGWQRDGSGSHVGPLYWDTVQSAAALISPAGLLSPTDVRVQGYFDVLEDRVLLENQNVGNRDWFQAGWQYQGGLERTPNMHLAADDIPVFIRSFLNCYAVDILPDKGYVFNEHAVHGPPDKIFEEAAFLERFRNLLVMEDGNSLWLARGTPRAWLGQGQNISVKHAPTRFGDVDYEIVSDVANGKITATVTMPTRLAPQSVILRLRHPESKPISAVTVNGKPWKDFDGKREVVILHGMAGTARVEIRY